MAEHFTKFRAQAVGLVTGPKCQSCDAPLIGATMHRWACVAEGCELRGRLRTLDRDPMIRVQTGDARERLHLLEAICKAFDRQTRTRRGHENDPPSAPDRRRPSRTSGSSRAARGSRR